MDNTCYVRTETSPSETKYKRRREVKLAQGGQEMVQIPASSCFSLS